MKYFKLFSNCKLVYGKNTCAIYDLQRSELIPIPKYIFEFLIELKDPIEKIIKKYDKNSEVEILNFLDQLVKNELGFFTNTPERFPLLEMGNYESPFLLENAIIEISRHSKYSINSVIKELIEIDCRFIQFRMLKDFDIEEFLQILSKFESSKIIGLEFYCKYDRAINLAKVKRIIKDNPRISKVVFYGANRNIKLKAYEHDRANRIVLISKVISITQRDIVDRKNFKLSIHIFNKAQKYNIGLFKKVCINHVGEIKNYLTHKKSFGRIGDSSILEIVKLKSFQETWNVSNDMIEFCKNCEYRFVCVNCSDLKNKDSKLFREYYCSDYLQYE